MDIEYVTSFDLDGAEDARLEQLVKIWLNLLSIVGKMDEVVHFVQTQELMQVVYEGAHYISFVLEMGGDWTQEVNWNPVQV